MTTRVEPHVAGPAVAEPLVDHAGLQVAAREIESMFAAPFGDGLPMVPVTAEAHEAMLASMALDGDASLGTIPPAEATLTAADVATCAVLAGCRPEYGPVVAAAARGLTHPAFALYGVACSTKGCAPLVIVNGPVCRRIDLNARDNLFGHGRRANATIGRAVRLVVQRVGRAEPGVLDRATLGHPGKHTFCIAEDEEASPWAPLPADRGVAVGTDAVTLVGAEGPRLVDVSDGEPDLLVAGLADAMAVTGGNTGVGIGDGHRAPPAVVVLAGEHRTLLADAGYGRHDVASAVAERAGSRSAARGSIATHDPADVLVVAAGGHAGRFSCVLRGWSATSRPVTVPLDRSRPLEIW
ncbi:MAG: hypothetical protein S0880_16350 [Actinomycetota bacterium]|nr:hypothetical protein [Actinomycetota bacterium]